MTSKQIASLVFLCLLLALIIWAVIWECYVTEMGKDNVMLAFGLFLATLCALTVLTLIVILDYGVFVP